MSFWKKAPSSSPAVPSFDFWKPTPPPVEPAPPQADFWMNGPAPATTPPTDDFWQKPDQDELPAPELDFWQQEKDDPAPPPAGFWPTLEEDKPVFIVRHKEGEPGDTVTVDFMDPESLDWDSVGSVSIVGNFGAFTPTVGDAMAQLYATGASAAQMEAFLGLASGALASLGLGNPTTGSAMLITLYTTAKTVDMSFDWLFNATDYLPYNDFGFFVGPDGNAVKLASIADVGNYGNSGWQTYLQETVPLDGKFTLGFGVTDVRDTAGSPYLFIDNIQGGEAMTPPEIPFWLAGQPSHEASAIGLDFWIG